VKVKELREFLEKFTEDDQVRFFTDQGSREFSHVKLVWDDIFYKEIAIIELD
jgi:type III secretory pathway component EscR